MPVPRRSRVGFTLVELLVVIAIIGVLIGLLLPAVQKVREASNRAACQNNIKQMAIACHGYHDANQSLPPADLADQFATWAVLVLPYLEQSQVYQGWNLKRVYYAQPATAGADLAVFHCPSRSWVGRWRGGDSRTYSSVSYAGPTGFGDYAACSGTVYNTGTEPWRGALVRTLNSAGGFSGLGVTDPTVNELPAWRPATNFANITDGTSQTLLFGEKYYPKANNSGRIFNGDYQSGYLRYVGHDGTQDPVTGRWTIELPLVADPEYSNAADWPYRFSAAYHPGQGVFALVDGSVRTVSASVNLDVLHRLAQRADGRVVAAAEYE